MSTDLLTTFILNSKMDTEQSVLDELSTCPSTETLTDYNSLMGDLNNSNLMEMITEEEKPRKFTSAINDMNQDLLTEPQFKQQFRVFTFGDYIVSRNMNQKVIVKVVHCIKRYFLKYNN
jgi:hypothetical protein